MSQVYELRLRLRVTDRAQVLDILNTLSEQAVLVSFKADSHTELTIKGPENPRGN